MTSLARKSLSPPTWWEGRIETESAVLRWVVCNRIVQLGAKEGATSERTVKRLQWLEECIALYYGEDGN